MRSIWKVERADPKRAAAISRYCGIDQLTAQLLLNRGVKTAQEALRFLNPSLQSLEDPELISGVSRAVARIRRAIKRREEVFLFGDSDTDGLTASVILYEILEELGGCVRIKHANRISDGYGLPLDLVRNLCRSSIKLVILVDCGTNQNEAIRELASCGIDTVVVDHHNPLGEPAHPYAFINPRVTNDPGWELSSAGLALKLAQVLLEKMHRLEAYMDIAALGTLADYSPLIGENRIIVSMGLRKLSGTVRRGLQLLCEATGAFKTDSQNIVRRLVPRINASGRLGDPSAAWHLLRREDNEKLPEWMKAAESAHSATKALYRQITAEAQEQVNRLHFRDHHVMVVSGSNWHQGLMGPIASQLAERYGRPAIALALNQRQGVGSGRSVPAFDLLSTLSQCREVLLAFGGHTQACGITLERKHVERFRDLVNMRAKEQTGTLKLTRQRTVDLELPLAGITRGWVDESSRLAPFGAGNPKPTLVIRGVKIEPKSSRMAWLSDGAVRMAARGSFLPDSDTRYDVVATPLLSGGEPVLAMNEVRISAGPSARVHCEGTSYKP